MPDTLTTLVYIVLIFAAWGSISESADNAIRERRWVSLASDSLYWFVACGVFIALVVRFVGGLHDAN